MSDPIDPALPSSGFDDTEELRFSDEALAFLQAGPDEENGKPVADGPLVLILEDEKSLNEGLVKALRSGGFQTESVFNGRDGLALLDRGVRPDLILSDINMPIMDGFEFVQNFRNSFPDMATVPIIFLTAYDDKRSELIGRRLGADDYLTKPIYDMELLLIRVRSRLDQVRRLNAAIRSEQTRILDALVSQKDGLIDAIESSMRPEVGAISAQTAVLLGEGWSEIPESARVAVEEIVTHTATLRQYLDYLSTVLRLKVSSDEQPVAGDISALVRDGLDRVRPLLLDSNIQVEEKIPYAQDALFSASRMRDALDHAFAVLAIGAAPNSVLAVTSKIANEDGQIAISASIEPIQEGYAASFDLLQREAEPAELRAWPPAVAFAAGRALVAMDGNQMAITRSGTKVVVDILLAPTEDSSA